MGAVSDLVILAADCALLTIGRNEPSLSMQVLISATCHARTLIKDKSSPRTNFWYQTTL